MPQNPDPNPLTAVDEELLAQMAQILFGDMKSFGALNVQVSIFRDEAELPRVFIILSGPSKSGMHYELTPHDARRVGERLVRLADKAEREAAENVAVRLVNLQRKAAE